MFPRRGRRRRRGRGDPGTLLERAGGYNYIGPTLGHLVAILGVLGGTAALWYLAQVDQDEADPLGTDRRRH